MRTRKLCTLLFALLCLTLLSTTAFARVDEDTGTVIETWAQIEEPPKPAVTPDPPAKPDTPKEDEKESDDGGFYTRDLFYDADTHKQFITVQGRDGNEFYIVIDYDVPVAEEEEQYKVYFLNQVDESDLAALVEDSGTATPPVCACTQKCAVGAVNTNCPVCAVNMSECVGKEPEPVQEPDPEPEPAPKSNTGSILIVLLLFALVGGGAAYYLNILKKKPDTKGSSDLDDYDYGDEDEEDADDESGTE